MRSTASRAAPPPPSTTCSRPTARPAASPVPTSRACAHERPAHHSVVPGRHQHPGGGARIRPLPRRATGRRQGAALFARLRQTRAQPPLRPRPDRVDAGRAAARRLRQDARRARGRGPGRGSAPQFQPRQRMASHWHRGRRPHRQFPARHRALLGAAGARPAGAEAGDRRAARRHSGRAGRAGGRRRDPQRRRRRDAVVPGLAAGRSVRLDASKLETENLERDVLRPLGIVRYDPEIAPVIGQVLPDSAAARAGFKPGDRVIAADGQAVANWQDWVQRVRQHPGTPLRIEYERQGQRTELTVIPDAVVEAGERIGRIGAAPQVDEAVLAALMTEVRYGPLDALWQGTVKTWDMSVFTLEMMGRMVLGQVSWRNLSGPLTIADYAGQSATLGWISFVGFLALVSVSLGVLNLLPIPLLDGGHLMYYVAEVFTGRPVSERTMEIGGRIGMALLLLLMSFALFNDLQRLFGE